MRTIGKIAALADTSADTLRYYEKEGLLSPDSKSKGGYRLYGDDVLRRIRFIKQAQQCGFTLSEIRELLTLRARESACCKDVRGLAIEKKLQLEVKVRTLQNMSRALNELISICKEDQPLDDCPILSALESAVGARH